MLKRKVNMIVIHCSATRTTLDYTPDMLIRDHKARGFSYAGYHFYIRKSGQRVPLRNLEEPGAHVAGYNSNTIGICYEGGLDVAGKPADTRTLQQKQSLSALIKELKQLAPGVKRVCGHRDLSPDKNGNGTIEPNEWVKMCPCFDAEKEYKSV